MEFFRNLWEWLNQYEHDCFYLERIYLGQTHLDHGHEAIAWNPEFIHTTENYIGAIYRRLRELWDAELGIGLARFYFQEDIAIYLDALAKSGITIDCRNKF